MKNKKIWAVITVARQIEGEYIFIKTEKAFEQASKAQALMDKLKKQYTAPDGKQKPVEIETEQGGALCRCTVGAFNLEVESDE